MELIIHEQYLLGCGLYGNVYFGTLDGEEVAVKEAHEWSPSLLAEESRLLELCDHPNVVKWIGDRQNGRYLIMEYARGGDLGRHLGFGKFSIGRKQSLVLQICSGLEYLHSKNIMHRDIKAQNLLFRDTQLEHILIADFGLAHFYTERSTFKNYHDIVPDLVYTYKSDIYLLGMLVFQIFQDWPGVDRLRLASRIRRAPCFYPLEIYGSEEIFGVIVRSVDEDPKKRPTLQVFKAAFESTAGSFIDSLAFYEF
ncbi:serine/threonine-protein kinase Nek7 [Galendromus occidentalis]|uniref:Serine/threonine-protein kinase Nek7 n=1 Tax=Galendromus occidentalis TaxID=34638 RepID=A0AAJ6VW60_9ACAR|nr:serine/threonine-protein kinase Nek7 [Galendromus occidentalis]